MQPDKENPMNRRNLRAAILAIGMAGPATWAQQDFSRVTIRTTHVAGNVYMLIGRGGNIGVSAGPDGMLIVDDQFAPLADKIRAALSELNPGSLRFILNTHWHRDHTGGNEVFGPQAPIIAHTNVRKRLMTRQQVFGRVIEPAPPQAWPVITFDHSVTVHFNGEDIRVIHYPHSHTDGDAVVFFTSSNVVHMGDLFFADMFPFVDVDSGGDVVTLATNIETIIKDLPPDVKIIPGHGRLATLDDLRRYHRMLVETTRIVRERMAAGQSLEQMQQAGLPEEWASWSKSFIPTDRWIEIVFRSLSSRQESPSPGADR